MTQNDAPATLLSEKQAQMLAESFAQLKNSVVLEVFTDTEHNPKHNEFVRAFTSELAALSPKITLHNNTLDSDAARKYNVTLTPTILFNPEQYHIRFTGAPGGEETKSFIETIFLVSSGKSGLSHTAAALMDSLDEPRDVRVFVVPTCPYCPGQVINAVRAALHRPDLVTAECVETDEFPELGQKYSVGSVPHTIINDKLNLLGQEPELRFIHELIHLQDFEESAREFDAAPDAPVTCDVIIIGGGPAGLTAAIYAKRSGMHPIVLEKAALGGQVALTPVVENYPAFTNISGVALMDMIATQARQYADIRIGEEVQEIKIGKMIEVITPQNTYQARAAILATGAAPRKLNIPGESDLFGKGVTYCATCDGYMFREKNVAVIGGGNTALTDALHLANLGAHPTIIHRRDSFRAEQHLQQAATNIPVIWNSTPTAINGTDHVTSITLTNLANNTQTELPTDGVIIAIGESPNKSLAEQLGLKLDSHGFITTENSGRTSIPRIYAAGDITGGVRQIVTAVGAGAAAALAVFEDLNNPYWKR